MHRLLIIFFLCSLIACHSDKEELKQSIPMKTVDSVAVESFGVRFYFSDSAKVTAELYASHVLEVHSKFEVKNEDKRLFKKYLSKAVDHVMSSDKGAKNFTDMVMEEAVRSFPKPKEEEKTEEEKEAEEKDNNKPLTNTPATPVSFTTLHYMEDSIHIDFLNQFGKPHSFIESESGIYNRDDDWAMLIEDVILKNEKGERLETELLFWDKTIDSVFTHLPVRITTPDKIITGSGGMRSNTAFTSYVIFGTYGEVSLKGMEEKEPTPKPDPKPIQKPRLIK